MQLGAGEAQAAEQATAAVGHAKPRHLESGSDHARLDQLACNIFMATALRTAELEFPEADHAVCYVLPARHALSCVCHVMLHVIASCVVTSACANADQAHVAAKLQNWPTCRTMKAQICQAI